MKNILVTSLGLFFIISDVISKTFLEKTPLLLFRRGLYFTFFLQKDIKPHENAFQMISLTALGNIMLL